MANGALRAIASDSSMMASIYKNSVVHNVWTHILCSDSEMTALQSLSSYTGERMLTRIEHARGKGFATRIPKRDKRRHTYSSCICLNSERRTA